MTVDPTDADAVAKLTADQLRELVAILAAENRRLRNAVSPGYVRWPTVPAVTTA